MSGEGGELPHLLDGEFKAGEGSLPVEGSESVHPGELDIFVYN